MFYSQFILAKKGPLGTIWIAAHLERKLRKNQVADTDIGVSVDSILFPEVPIALRLSSHLLLGVVRIYSRKVNYLFDDCSEALLKVKQAFRSTAVDLPPEESKAPYHSITLPETFDLDDFELPDSDIFQGDYVDHHISSREQITLQDNMENVVYPTSQFGLDERFGDGDTSGLDLDEELFLDKVNAAGNAGLSVDPQPSVQPMMSLKQHENDDGIPTNSEAMLGVAGEDIDLMDYAEAPCTPGLVEEPNLSNVQETSACDDHMEPEDNTLTESAVKENLENISCKSNLNQVNAHVKDWLVPEDTNSDAVDHMPCEENGYHSSDLGTKQGQSPNTEVNIEQASSDDPAVAAESSCLADKEVTVTGQEPILTENVIDASDGLDKGDQNGILKVNGAGASSVNSLNKDHGDCNGIISKVNAQDHSCLSSTSQQLGILNNIQGESIDTEVAGNPEKPCSPNGALCLDCQLQDMSCHACPEGQVYQESNLVVHDEKPSAEVHLLRPCNAGSGQLDLLDTGNGHSNDLQSVADTIPESNLGVHDEMPSAEGQLLRPCNAGSGQLDLLHTGNGHSNDLQSMADTIAVEPAEGGELIDTCSYGGVMDGEKCRKVDESVQNLKENCAAEHAALDDVHPSFGRSDDQVNVDAGNSALKDINSSAGMYLPAPEKLLSVPEGFGGPRDLLVEATPGDLTHVDESDAGSRIISGKKRSYTESTLTEQSLNSVESSRVVRAKRNVEAVPDDDDLLSSILVGRRSSVLKVKPTPPPSEITSLKCQRSAPRTSASKRKVLMDDTMVLHGDTIRQQLTNTEDIRRIRKKAPCTLPEIAMIQKQFLEEEIFGEPICLGVSMELASLHNRTYDLSRIIITRDEISDTSLLAAAAITLTSGNDECVNDFGVDNVVWPGEPTINVASDMGGVNELEAVREILQPIENPLPSENKMDEHHDFVEADMSQQQMKHMEDGTVAAESSSPQPEHSQRLPENSVFGGSCLVTEALDPAFTSGIESRDQVLGDVGQALDGAVQATLIDENGVMYAPVSSTDEKREMECVEVNASLIGGSNEIIDYENGVVKDDDAVAALETEPDAKDGISLEVYHRDGTVEIERNCFEQGEYNVCGPSIEIETDFGRVEYHDQLFHEATSAEQPIVDSSYPADSVNVQGSSLDDWEYAMQHETYPATAMDGEISGIHMHDRADVDYMAAANDTEFLNVDDDEVAEVTDDYTPNQEEIRFTENSGWSSRTRAVAKYLQTLFVKEEESGRNVLPMDNLLVGKTRKEASRMFFEALVLKTRDYIHVEQERPFDNIAIKPQTKLMKSDF